MAIPPSAPPPPGPPPPPPPPSASSLGTSSKHPSGGDARSALLQSIQKGTKLKKTVTNDKSGPALAGRICDVALGGGGGGGGGGSPKYNNSQKNSFVQSNSNIANNRIGNNTPKLGGLFEGMSSMPKLKPVNGTPAAVIQSANQHNNSPPSATSTNHCIDGQMDFNTELTKHLTLKRQKQQQTQQQQPHINATEANLKTNRGPPPQPPTQLSKVITTSTSDPVLEKNKININNSNSGSSSKIFARAATTTITTKTFMLGETALVNNNNNKICSINGGINGGTNDSYGSSGTGSGGTMRSKAANLNSNTNNTRNKKAHMNESVVPPIRTTITITSTPVAVTEPPTVSNSFRNVAPNKSTLFSTSTSYSANSDSSTTIIGCGRGNGGSGGTDYSANSASSTTIIGCGGGDGGGGDTGYSANSTSSSTIIGSGGGDGGSGNTSSYTFISNGTSPESSASASPPTKSPKSGNNTTHQRKPNFAPKPPGLLAMANGQRPVVARHHSMKSPRSPPIMGGPLFSMQQQFGTMRTPFTQSHEAINSGLRTAPQPPIGRPTVKPPPPPTPARSTSNTNLNMSIVSNGSSSSSGTAPPVSACNTNLINAINAMTINATTQSTATSATLTNSVAALREQFRNISTGGGGNNSCLNVTPSSISNTNTNNTTTKSNNCSPSNSNNKFSNSNSHMSNGGIVNAPPLPPHRSCPAPPPPPPPLRQPSHTAVPPVPPQRHSSIRANAPATPPVHHLTNIQPPQISPASGTNISVFASPSVSSPGPSLGSTSRNNIIGYNVGNSAMNMNMNATANMSSMQTTTTTSAPPPPPPSSSAAATITAATTNVVSRLVIDLETKYGKRFHNVTEFPKPPPFVNIPKAYSSRTVKATNGM